MDAKIAAKLIELNRSFYAEFAGAFSETRQRLQPGVQRLSGTIPAQARLIDLGCGNGELLHTLRQAGYVGDYLGIDFSPELLAQARLVESLKEHSEFVLADLTRLEEDVSLQDGIFDVALAFAVFHHLPGKETRWRLLEVIRRILKPDGQLLLSNWQFLNSPRLSNRIQPWETIGLSSLEVETGDYLLDWRRGGTGLRYAHQFTPDELFSLAGESGFKVVETFFSDGEAGKLGLYQVWGKRG